MTVQTLVPRPRDYGSNKMAKRETPEGVFNQLHTVSKCPKTREVSNVKIYILTCKRFAGVNMKPAGCAQRRRRCRWCGGECGATVTFVAFVREQRREHRKPHAWIGGDGVGFMRTEVMC